MSATTSVTPSRSVDDDDYLYDTLSASGAFTWKLPKDSTEWSLPRVGALVGQARRDLSEALRSALAGRAALLVERDSQSAALAFNADQAMARLAEAPSRVTKTLAHVSQRITDDIAAQRTTVERLANGHESTLMHESRRLTAVAERSRIETLWRFDALGVVLITTGHTYQTQAALDDYTADRVAIGTEAGHDWANARQAEVAFAEPSGWDMLARRLYYMPLAGPGSLNLATMHAMVDAAVAAAIDAAAAAEGTSAAGQVVVDTVVDVGAFLLKPIGWACDAYGDTVVGSFACTAAQQGLTFSYVIGDGIVTTLSAPLVVMAGGNVLAHMTGVQQPGGIYLRNYAHNALVEQSAEEFAFWQQYFAIASLPLGLAGGFMVAPGKLGRFARTFDVLSDPFQWLGSVNRWLHGSSTIGKAQKVMGLADDTVDSITSIAARQQMVAARSARLVTKRGEVAALLREARTHGMTKELRNRLRGLGQELGWAEEQMLVRVSGQGTRAWTADEIADLLKDGRVKNYTDHHINSVSPHEWMAGNRNNIQIVERWAEHGKIHNGNAHLPTSGDLINRSRLIVDAIRGL